ncbi:hypothetical protein [Iodobacter fluviatilis]|uniref:Uncharacterized protein n=1 Tax=Iodobacter fluviatilis TaxID=537 RepID=A0A7G3G5H4_9NEIS|nr:hypothetical protein [Iodobacter fluviatilis]QBC42389.1 hypothetical protein C1H71_01630 [Iodobacter fluviatilis]
MSGLIVFPILFVWIYISVRLSLLITHWLPDVWWRGVISTVLFFVLLPMPLMDEIIAKKQFEKLCKENESTYFDKEAVGKTVYLDSKPEIKVQGTAVPIALHPWRFIDASTKELLVSYNTLRADGGFYYGCWVFLLVMGQ